MSDNQSRLPEYVGKKIVEALKQENDERDLLEDNRASFTSSFVQNNNNVSFERNVETVKDTQIISSRIMPDMQDDKIEISDLELPDNVVMLVNLINQLPSGVSRQVGAQIIRQTIEAMGISMKSVLSEAQYIQEDLGNSTQDCINTIEEYKNNIRILEQKIVKYKKQANKLGELINLFVMTIK